MSATDLMSDIKVAWLTVTGTIGTGLGTITEMIPNDIGKLSTVVGLILSVVLIYIHLKKSRTENLIYEKIRLEIKIMKEKEAERLEANRHKDD